jgi:hypothetical protein
LKIQFLALVIGLFISVGILGPISVQTANAASFSNASLSGAYAAVYHGSEWFTPPGGSDEKIDFTATGLTHYDGNGNQHGNITLVIQGDNSDLFVTQVVCTATFSGTYSVNPNGTGTKSFASNFVSGPCSNNTGTLSFVIGNGGSELKLQATSASIVSPDTNGVINSIIETVTETQQ